MNKTKKRNPKSKQERGLVRSLCYLRLVERRLEDATAIGQSQEEFGKIEGLSKHIEELRTATKNAITRMKVAQARYLAAFGIKCTTCGNVLLPEGNFHRNESRPNGYQNRCIVCCKARRES